ncbi:MAG: hypothetical protein WBO46_25155, partial [Caldilineaceae bacterium]
MPATTIAPPVTQSAANGAARGKQPVGIVDCDVHHQYDKPETLFPYLPRHYVEYIKDFGPMMPGIGYTNMPGNGARTDLWTDSEVNPATQPSVCIEKHLNVYDIAIGVLTGGPYAAAVHPDADYAAAICRAFNDWTLDTWTSQDSRLRASIHIAPQDPALAVAEIERLGPRPEFVQVL